MAMVRELSFRMLVFGEIHAVWRHFHSIEFEREIIDPESHKNLGAAFFVCTFQAS
jgi:hypothetical protein